MAGIIDVANWGIDPLMMNILQLQLQKGELGQLLGVEKGSLVFKIAAPACFKMLKLVGSPEWIVVP